MNVHHSLIFKIGETKLDVSMFSRIFIYTHRRMAITAEDVSLEDIIPISLDFAVVEGELFSCTLPH